MSKSQNIEINNFDVDVEIVSISKTVEVNSFDVDVILDE